MERPGNDALISYQEFLDTFYPNDIQDEKTKITRQELETNLFSKTGFCSKLGPEYERIRKLIVIPKFIQEFIKLIQEDDI